MFVGKFKLLEKIKRFAFQPKRIYLFNVPNSSMITFKSEAHFHVFNVNFDKSCICAKYHLLKKVIALTVPKKRMLKDAFNRGDFRYWSMALIRKRIFFKFDKPLNNVFLFFVFFL